MIVLVGYGQEMSLLEREERCFLRLEDIEGGGDVHIPVPPDVLARVRYLLDLAEVRAVELDEGGGPYIEEYPDDFPEEQVDEPEEQVDEPEPGAEFEEGPDEF